MNREEIEREIAERLAAVLGEDATVPGNVGNWLAVAREVMVMMEKVVEFHVVESGGYFWNDTDWDLSPAVEES